GLRGIAGGLALASVAQMGFVALVYNTFPETVSRPLAQMALPLVRAGFVPHHAGELVGWDGATFWYVVVACLAVASALAAFWPLGDRVRTYALRVVCVAAFGAVALLPAFSWPAQDEGGDGSGDVRFFAMQWEPPGRDRISALREEADRWGPRGPCLWHRLADLERLVHWDYEAERDEARAGATTRDACRLPPIPPPPPPPPPPRPVLLPPFPGLVPGLR